MRLRSALLSITILVSTAAFAAPLDSTVENMVSEGGAKRAVWGVYAIDSKSGAVLVDINGTRLHTPASNRKLVTAAMLCWKFQADETITTELRGGTISGGAISGDLVLRAGGDPTWTPELLGGASGHTKLTTLAKEAAKNGLKHVNGDLVVDTGIYDVAEPIPPGWAWDNLDASYAGKPSALSFNENLVGVTVKPGRGAEPLDVTLAISSQAFEIINQSRTLGGGSAPTLRINRSLDGQAVTVAGGLPQGSQGSTVTLPTGRPVAMAAELMRKALEKEGIVIDGTTRVDRNVERPPAQIAAVTGAPVSQALRVCLRESDNFLAESLYLLASTKRFGSAGYQGAYKMESEYWKSIGVDSSEIHPADGSGLSREDFISPHALVSLLKANEKVDWFVDSLPVSGQSGTLKYRLSDKGLAGRVVAKTGTLDSTAALSGYIKCPSGKIVIFSIMANNYTCSTNTIRAKIDDIVELLAQR
ncbi:D-alanyl-D-alanine carboxypeptidase/D-alanyl-D-alanine-endopeptidase [Candidatus Sumerlaeota bacterium]|nr:D-alanyl-D-alanine carboxypeptidase/D-alanyl-D-alanine-endopeptidase [Candidatus Sumerlaeota bacterium]